MRMLAVCLSLFALACSTTPDVASSKPRDPGSARLANLLPTPQRAFTLHATPESAPKLRDVLVELERATGVSFVITDGARDGLARASSGLLSDLEVPPASAWRVVQTMLVENGLMIEPSRGGDPMTVVVYARSSSQPGDLKARAIEVPTADVAACANHPAVLFMVVVEVEALDARQLATTLRQVHPDQQTQSIMPVASNQLLLVGSGRDVASVAAMVRTSDAMRKSGSAAGSADPAREGAVAAPR